MTVFVGIISILDEECTVPQGSDRKFQEKIFKMCQSNSHLARVGSKVEVVRRQEHFVIKHYAGDVRSRLPAAMRAQYFSPAISTALVVLVGGVVRHEIVQQVIISEMN